LAVSPLTVIYVLFFICLVCIAHVVYILVVVEDAQPYVHGAWLL